MTETHEVLAKAILSVVGLAVVLAGARLRQRSAVWQQRVRLSLVALAVAAGGAYVNFGTFHGGGLFPHYWEHFHYFLGAKYFREVGYDGLYVASMGAQMQGTPDGRFQPFLRDLRTNEVVPTATVEALGLEVHNRFTPERWAGFRRDNLFFVRLDPAYLLRIRMDHGYNPSPAWTALAQLLIGDRRASARTFALLGAVDLLLLALAFVLFFRTYGVEVGCLALVVFGTGYAWRWYWTGGGLLRQDWLAATIVGICLLHRRRFALAGAALAYAAMVRVFPLVFVAPLVVVAARDHLQGRGARWLARFVGGFALASLLLFAAGSGAGRGGHAWMEFAKNLEKHGKSWLTNNVGLVDTILYGPETYERRLVHWELPEPWIEWQAHMDTLLRERRLWLLAAAAALALLVAFAAWRGEPDEAAALGPALVFAFAALTCYYWGMLAVTLVRRARPGPWATAAALLAGNLGLCASHFLAPSFEVRFGAMSWGLLVFFVWWLWPRRPVEAGAEAPVTAARAGARSRAAKRAAASRP